MTQQRRGMMDILQQYTQMLQEGRLQRCKVCGGEFQSVIKHALKAHDMSEDEYEQYMPRRDVLRP